jgi:alkylation response protein AidB-like acyl-CoA dehydrogenase
LKPTQSFVIITLTIIKSNVLTKAQVLSYYTQIAIYKAIELSEASQYREEKEVPVFKLTEEQEMIRQMVRQLVQDKVAPLAAKIDETEDFPEECFRAFVDNGLFKLSLPEEYGGIKCDSLTLSLVIEEISKVSPACALMVFSTQSVIRVIRATGNEEQKKRFFSGFSRGDRMGAFGLTEPGYGSDAANLQTKAILKGNDYLMNGTKLFITTADVAHYYLIFARTGPGERAKGISAFIVEKGTPGFSIGKKEDKMGLRGSITAELIFEDAIVPANNRLGEEGEGWRILTEVGNQMRVWGVASVSLGIAEGAYEYALKYAQERRQFGRPIADFQAVRFMLADMKIGIEAVRSLLWRTASMIDQDQGTKKDQETMVCIAKCFASDTALKVATDAVQILGGYGYMKDYPVERMMRDAKSTQIIDGTNQIQRVIISRNILRS